MSTTYIRSLLVRGANVQKAIERELSRPRPDSLRLLQLKKLRLVIADRLSRLRRRPEVSDSSRLVAAPAVAGMPKAGESREARTCR